MKTRAEILKELETINNQLKENTTLSDREVMKLNVQKFTLEWMLKPTEGVNKITHLTTIELGCLSVEYTYSYISDNPARFDFNIESVFLSYKGTTSSILESLSNDAVSEIEAEINVFLMKKLK